MNKTRRHGLQAASAGGLYAALVAIGMVRPGTAVAATEDIFLTKGIKNTLEAMGAKDATESGEISLIAPDIAENGAVVPVRMSSTLPKTEMLALLVEKNPNALAGSFEILGDTKPEVSMRIKMGQSSDIVAVVKADGKFYTARKEVKVTLGGCGG
ncbi:MAG: thiosulfate oxidation carrier protein SoxY [Burkholderiaceae bacterium]